VHQGVIQDTSAFAKFHVTFECIVFRPFKGEVLDCVVTSVNKARLGHRQCRALEQRSY
jgi:DNA-directed RNA polymerase II subunit RPB7